MAASFSCRHRGRKREDGATGPTWNHPKAPGFGRVKGWRRWGSEHPEVLACKQLESCIPGLTSSISPNLGTKQDGDGPHGYSGTCRKEDEPGCWSVWLDDISAHAFLTKLAFPQGKRAFFPTTTLLVAKLWVSSDTQRSGQSWDNERPCGSTGS